MSFKNDIQPILNTNCIGCHNSDYSGDVKLYDYENVIKVAKEPRFVGVISYDPNYKGMPTSGKMSDCNINKIKSWVSQGALNN